jgi:hypothetical protein
MLGVSGARRWSNRQQIAYQQQFWLDVQYSALILIFNINNSIRLQF